MPQEARERVKLTRLKWTPENMKKNLSMLYDLLVAYEGQFTTNSAKDMAMRTDLRVLRMQVSEDLENLIHGTDQKL